MAIARRPLGEHDARFAVGIRVDEHQHGRRSRDDPGRGRDVPAHPFVEQHRRQDVGRWWERRRKRRKAFGDVLEPHVAEPA